VLRLLIETTKQRRSLLVLLLTIVWYLRHQNDTMRTRTMALPLSALAVAMQVF
jgi:hypothetical protein